MKTLRLPGLALAGLLLAGCGGKEKEAGAGKAPPRRDPREVVARVDDTTLTRGEMDRLARGYLAEESRTMLVPKAREEETMEHFRRRAVEVFIFRTVMLDEARRKGVVLTAADRREGTNRMQRTVLRHRGVALDTFFAESPFGEAAARAEFEAGMIIDKLFKQEIEPRLTVSEEEIGRLAGELIARRAEKRKQIETLRERLLGGEDFAALAAAHSECPSRRRGGDLGQFPRGKMVEPFDKAVFSQQIGEIGPVIETEAGFHIVKVTARHAARPAGEGLPAIPETAQASHILVKAPPPMTRLKLAEAVRRAKNTRLRREYYNTLRSERRVESIYDDVPAP